MKYLLDLPPVQFLRAWAADSFIRLGYAIAPDYYLMKMFEEE